MNNMVTNFKNDILIPLCDLISHSCTHINNGSDKVLYLFRVSILYIISCFLEELGIYLFYSTWSIIRLYGQSIKFINTYVEKWSKQYGKKYYNRSVLNLYGTYVKKLISDKISLDYDEQIICELSEDIIFNAEHISSCLSKLTKGFLSIYFRFGFLYFDGIQIINPISTFFSFIHISTILFTMLYYTIKNRKEILKLQDNLLQDTKTLYRYVEGITHNRSDLIFNSHNKGNIITKLETKIKNVEHKTQSLIDIFEYTEANSKIPIQRVVLLTSLIGGNSAYKLTQLEYLQVKLFDFMGLLISTKTFFSKIIEMNKITKINTDKSISDKIKNIVSEIIIKYNKLFDNKDSVKVINNRISHITISELNFSYPGQDTLIFSKLNYEIKGNFILFFAQSGVGKSTLISLLTKKLVPNSGSIKFIDVSNKKINDPKFSYKNQKDVMYLGNVNQNLFYYNDELTDYDIEIRNFVCEIFEIDQIINSHQESNNASVIVDIFDKIHFTRVKDKLSGGEIKRLALARVFIQAIIYNVRIIFLDEPTSGLDREAARKIWKSINKICTDHNIKLCAFDHPGAYWYDVREIFDEIHVMEKNDSGITIIKPKTDI